ncbi:hypothetical protein [Acinetobacter pittii]|uniref:hypothetical protein n=1 Tax=Acinetobacter pittii TaxID=48296 RepID=UPI001FD7195A|nr:hypothetical protein [Acinetobacter pittii]
MTELEILRSDLTVAHFVEAANYMLIIGLVAGFIISRIFFEFFQFVVNLTSDHFKRPKRIKFASLDNNSIEYLYLFRGRYYTSVQYQALLRQAIHRLKEQGI